MSDIAKEHQTASNAYYVSFASLGLGLPIPFLSLAAGIGYHLIQAPRSRFVAFHSWQALIIGFPASIVVGLWSAWGLGIFADYFMSAGHSHPDLSTFWITGAAGALLLAGEVILGIRQASAALQGDEKGLPWVGSLARALSR